MRTGSKPSPETRQHRKRRPCRPTLFVMSVLCLGFVSAGAASAPDDQRAGRVQPFLLEATDVRLHVTGTIARAVVTQHWHNPNTDPVDGLYVFPLPQDAAVTDMRLEVGERVIESEMKRREEARELYEQARREGRLAGLLDQERPNVFAQRVANLMPGEKIRVVLSYDQPIGRESGRYELVFPTVVGPRFVPAHQTDPGEVLPPVTVGEGGSPQRLTLSVSLETGMPIRGIESTTHPIDVRHDGGGSATVRLARGGRERLDRDFTLRWSLAGEEPEIGVLAYRDPELGAEGIFSLLVEPPAAPRDDEITPREIVFVLDCSGSMNGEPLRAAKDVVRRVLRTLHPRDRFQIIRFSEGASGLSPAPLPNTPHNISRALAYLERLRGSGGTMMIEGIKAALDGQTDSGRMRVVAFLTDGYIGNEREILAAVRERIGDARLFGFGIGSSVNRYLLEGLAEEGRGAAAFRTPRESADELVERFVERISAPVLTDVRIAFEDVEAFDIEPAPIPDLFAGQPLVLNGRYRRPGTGVLIVSGKVAGEPVTFRRVVRLPEREVEHEALGRLWARARVHRLERELHRGEREDVVERISELALRHRLMTRYTSLVAVDSEVVNPEGGAVPVEVPVELPQDVPITALGNQQVVSGVGYAPAARSSDSTRRRALAELQARSGVGAKRMPPVEERPATGTGEDAESATAGDVAFETLRLIESDGSELLVEADGEVWMIDGRRRSLVTVLRADTLSELRRTLHASTPASWSAAPGGGARLVLTTGDGRYSASVRGGGETVEALANLVRSFSR